MRRGLKISAALATAFALLPAATSAAKPHWTDYDRPAEFGVTNDKGVEIPMRDGIVLEANVQRPDAEGQFPALIIQTPYNKDGPINLALGGAAN
jgi:uncharacterized protein